MPILTRRGPRAARALAAALALGAVPTLPAALRAQAAPRAVPGLAPRLAPRSAPAPSAGGAAPSPLAVSAGEYAARRRALVDALPDSVGALVAFGAREPEADYQTFSQSPDFSYLTGFAEPDAALVMTRGAGGWDAVLFVQPRDPAREVWTGRRAGVAGAPGQTGLAARATDALRPALDSLAGALAADGRALAVSGALRGAPESLPPDAQLIAALRRAAPGLRVVPAGGAVARLRGTKSAAELARIRRAVDVTVRAQRAAMGAVAPGVNEFEVQALIEYTFRRSGADRPSFATIVGSGPNSTTLHYNADDRVMRAGEVVVMDIGASYGGYAADVTRTVPVSGRFTPDQRAVYQLVRDAQASAERAAVLGGRYAAASDSARATVARGLARLGLVEAADATYDCGPAADRASRQCPQAGLYFMHGLGHGIGLEVHDPDPAVSGAAIAPGSAFTIEPGVYVRERLLEDVVPDTPRNRRMADAVRAAVRRYANIGVRIEDDYVATGSGVEWISRAPREAAEVEAAMRAGRLAAGRAQPRDRALVESYRAGW
jgi:Xaa-Pro aminopeptidase